MDETHFTFCPCSNRARVLFNFLCCFWVRSYCRWKREIMSRGADLRYKCSSLVQQTLAVGGWWPPERGIGVELRVLCQTQSIDNKKLVFYDQIINLHDHLSLCVMSRVLNWTGFFQSDTDSLLLLVWCLGPTLQTSSRWDNAVEIMQGCRTSSEASLIRSGPFVVLLSWTCRGSGARACLRCCRFMFRW